MFVQRAPLRSEVPVLLLNQPTSNMQMSGRYSTILQAREVVLKIDCIISDPPQDSSSRCLRKVEGNIGEDFVLKIVFWLSHLTEYGQYQALLLRDMK